MTKQDIGKITDEVIAKARSRIGIEKLETVGWNKVATKQAIRHWAWGIGDLNPLWQDEEYAQQTKYGCIVAPPSFLYSCLYGPRYEIGGKPSRGTGLPGLHGLYTGDDFEFYRPIIVNDSITVITKLADIIEKKGKYAGRALLEIREATFKNQRNEIIARTRSHRYVFERQAAEQKGKYVGINKYKYTDEELQRIEEDYDKEDIRGSNPRYWEDVREGDTIGKLIKGPLTSTSIVSFLIGGGPAPYCMTDKIAHLYMRLHPGAGVRDPETNVPDLPERVHWDPWFAKAIGMSAGGYDLGPQRISWVCQLMTDWMGNDGFLKRLDIQLRRPNFLGNTVWCQGKVTKKYFENDEHLVDCELWDVNQTGETTVRGGATVRLLSRGS